MGFALSVLWATHPSKSEGLSTKIFALLSFFQLEKKKSDDLTLEKYMT